MTKTEEESEYIARLYIILENYDVESAVEQYSTFIEGKEELDFFIEFI